VLVAERLVEGVGIGPAVRRVEDEVARATRTRLLLERSHQRLPDPAPAEPLRHDEGRDLAPQLVALDEVLGVERTEAGDLAFNLGDDQARRRVRVDPLDALGGLPLRRGVPQVAEKSGDGIRVSALGVANAYGGGGGPPGGAWSSTYVVLLRPHCPP